MKKVLISLAIVAGVFTSAAFAYPIFSPSCPVVKVPVVYSTPTFSTACSTYKSIRTFWLSRALVR